MLILYAIFIQLLALKFVGQTTKPLREINIKIELNNLGNIFFNFLLSVLVKKPKRQFFLHLLISHLLILPSTFTFVDSSLLHKSIQFSFALTSIT